MRHIRTYHDVSDSAGAEVLEQVMAQRERLARRLAEVRQVVAVASGKGGVGKSALTANLAVALADRGLRVGAADADLNGPSLARMLGVAPQRLMVEGDAVRPASGAAGVGVMSMELLLPAEDAPLRWREPAAGDGTGFIWQSTVETGAVREFLADVAWGRLDFLLIDAPPGTDKLGRLLTLLPASSILLLVTTPSEMARAVVARALTLARDAGVSRLGIAANMTSWVCRGCGRSETLFPGDGARRLAREMGAELWAEIPFDPGLAASTDAGRPYVLENREAPVSRALHALAERLLREAEQAGGGA